MVRIGIVGIGPVGRTLGTLWARAGHEVAFGSRAPARAVGAAMGLAGARATTQEQAAAFGEVVLWTPRGVMPADPDMLAGTIVLDPNNREPGPVRGYASPRPEGPSFAEQLQAAPPRARVVKAFNTVVMRLLREDPERLRASAAQVFLAGEGGGCRAGGGDRAGRSGSRGPGSRVDGRGDGRRVPPSYGDKPCGVASSGGIADLASKAG